MKEHEMGKPARAIPPQDLELGDELEVMARINAVPNRIQPATTLEERSPFLPANRH